MLQLPTEEYELRLDFIRRGMVQLELDVILVYSWKRGQVRYISGYKPNLRWCVRWRNCINRRDRNSSTPQSIPLFIEKYT